jgi:uncharacterized protein (TIGR03437 family)
MKPLALLFAVSALSFGYVNSNPRTYRTDNTNIQFLVNVDSANVNNANGVPWITPGTDVLAGAIAAMDSWNSVTTANIHFAIPQTTTLLEGTPTNNVISFDSSSEVVQALGSALAVTITSYNADGSIVKSDIVFSTKEQFSTTGDASALDLQSILTHELGHSLGSSHSGVLTGTMFQATDAGLTTQAHLKPDDIAFASSLYPVGNAYGTITGTMRDTTGKALRGALISAEDPVSGQIIGGFSSIADGTFSFSVPPGSYYVWAEPLNGQVQAANVYLTASEVDTDWQPVIAGGFASPSLVNVTAGQPTPVALSAPVGVSPIQIDYSGATATAGASFEIYTGPTSIAGGETVFFVFIATGLPSTVTDANFKAVGPFTIVPGSFRSSSSEGKYQCQLSLNMPSVSELTTASLLIDYNGNSAVFSGGIEVLPAAPSFPANGIGNAFSFASSAVAPGEIAAMFGTNMGPASGLFGAFTTAGYLTDQVEGVSVRFDGIPAPLFYAAAGQINVQVPYEVAGESETSVVVDTGTDSVAVSVPVSAAVPGLYPAAVNFANNLLNTVANPVAPGDYVILYATGLGSPLTPIDTGEAAPGADASANAVTVTLGSGSQLMPAYAGVTQGLAGLDQINLQIPAATPRGETSLFVTSANGAQSQTISVWVQ